MTVLLSHRGEATVVDAPTREANAMVFSTFDTIHAPSSHWVHLALSM
jgi:hypothetical protein